MDRNDTFELARTPRFAYQGANQTYATDLAATVRKQRRRFVKRISLDRSDDREQSVDARQVLIVDDRHRNIVDRESVDFDIDICCSTCTSASIRTTGTHTTRRRRCRHAGLERGLSCLRHTLIVFIFVVAFFRFFARVVGGEGKREEAECNDEAETETSYLQEGDESSSRNEEEDESEH